MTSFDRRTLLLGTLGVAGTVGLAGCQGTEATSAPTTTAPSVTPTPTPTADTRARWPLTGKLLDDPADAHHAAVAVKVPDNQNEHPQDGLDRADIVYVQLDGYRDASGYSGTRLVPVFHSHMAADVAPVRSMRPVDIPMLSPMHALIGNTGGTPWVVAYAKHYKKYLNGMLSYLETKGTGSYTIDPNRVRRYQGVTYYDRAVVCHPKVLARQTKNFRSGPPQAYLPWATGDEQPSTATGERATHIRVPWKKGDSYDMAYAYDKKTKKYRRSMPWGPHTLSNGRRVAPDNVLVIRAAQRYGHLYPGAGGQEPIHEIINAQGTFYYFHGGRYVKGTWAKGAVQEVFTFTLADGSPLKMAPGQTYIELPAAKAKIKIKA